MSKNEVTYAVNLKSPIAVYVQLENQVQFAITAGRYKAGDLLPSVRDMSDMVGVNPNTVTKAYRDLELMGLVNTRRGVGVTVSEKAAKLCRINTLAMVTAHLQDAVAQCTASGMGESQITQEVKRVVAAGILPYQE